MEGFLMHQWNGDWPENCVWPKPLKAGEGDYTEWDMIEGDRTDEACEELLEIKEYYDGLVEEGILNEDYSLNEEYEPEDEEEAEVYDPFEFFPEKGEDYWDNGFDFEGWEEELINHYNLLKLPQEGGCPAEDIRRLIDYEFINENLLRQAFTRRAFAAEHGLDGCGEELEFLGDSALNTVVTREIIRQMTEVDETSPEAPFRTGQYDEGILTKIRSQYVSKEYLSSRAGELGLGRYILYGSGEKETESSLEDAVEALIGAVAVDSGWDWDELENVVDRLMCIQLTNPDRFLKKTYYEIFNSWHQKRFGRIPSYEVYPCVSGYDCTLRYSVPENDQGIRTAQRIDVRRESRSLAREEAAFEAYCFVRNSGLWMNLKDSGIIPDPENAINQLQELYQKKYVDAPAAYEFEEWRPDEWNCDCVFGGVHGFGKAGSKTKAKKEAAYMALIRLMRSAGVEMK